MIKDEERTVGWQSWAIVRALAANRSRWKENLKALYYVPYGTWRDKGR